MTKAWARFWTAMAVMTASGVAAWFAVTGWSVGTLGEWFAGLATASAVVVALYIAQRQGQLAIEMAQGDREERRRELLDGDIRVLKAILLVLANGHGAIAKLQSFDDELGGDSAKDAILDFGRRIDKVVTRMLDDVRIEQLPSTTSVDAIMAARSAWFELTDSIYGAQDELFPAMSLNVLDLSHLDKIIDAIADEVVTRGGKIDGVEDTEVIARLEGASARRIMTVKEVQPPLGMLHPLSSTSLRRADAAQ